MKKYKQKKIPEIESDIFDKASTKEIRHFISDYFNKNYKGKSVKNIDTGIIVEFINKGRKKISFGSKIYKSKALAVLILNDLIKYAEYNNFGNRKRNDSRHILGYLNFKVKAKINNQYKFLRITVIIANTGKFYYHHEINIYKK